MNPIIDKIRKLLRLGKDSKATPNEAAVAMAKAMQLAAAHGIDLSQIPDDTGSNGGISHTTEPSQAGLPHRLASMLVKRHFSVSTLFDSTGKKPVIHFIGLPNNCDLALYCYVFLVRSMRTAWRKRENRRLRDRASFLRGYAAAIDSLMPATFHQPGLIISADEYIETVILANQHGVKIKTLGNGRKNKISDAAFRNGYRQGKQTGIHNAIRGSETLNLG
jgi:hypothetical protein